MPRLKRPAHRLLRVNSRLNAFDDGASGAAAVAGIAAEPVARFSGLVGQSLAMGDLPHGQAGLSLEAVISAMMGKTASAKIPAGNVRANFFSTTSLGAGHFHERC